MTELEAVEATKSLCATGFSPLIQSTRFWTTSASIHHVPGVCELVGK